MAVFFFVAVTGGAVYYFIHFNQSTWYAVSACLGMGMAAWLAYRVYLQYRMHKERIPAITISSLAIEITDGKKTTTVLWTEVSGWKIEKDEGSDYLFIDSPAGRKRTSINYLDKTPWEIEQLILAVKPR